MVVPAELIERKRDGGTLSPDELREFLGGYLRGEVADYQMSAFLMAVCFRGLTDEELRVFTRAIVDSGARLEFPGAVPAVDKHSTGGVGDTVSLVLAPLLAEAGYRVPMMSGRGLGHTGGTLDKLESIPGFRTDLDLEEFREVVEEVGCAMIGQSKAIAPLDGELYALRDVTGTVPSVPLIASSIVSKKLAEGIGALVLDVKFGRGAFTVERERALELARTMVSLAAEEGLACRALLTDMDAPLAMAAGNALEVREALRCLQGETDSDLARVTLALAAEAVAAVEPGGTPEAARRDLEGLLASGRAGERFARLVERQGGDPRAVDDPDRLPSAPVRRAARAPSAGRVRGLDAREVGLTCVELGAGRRRMEEEVDPAVGVELRVRRGDRVEEGEEFAVVHARDDSDASRAAGRLAGALELAEGTDGGPPPRRVHARVTSEGVERLPA